MTLLSSVPICARSAVIANAAAPGLPPDRGALAAPPVGTAFAVTVQCGLRLDLQTQALSVPAAPHNGAGDGNVSRLPLPRSAGHAPGAVAPPPRLGKFAGSKK